MNSSKAKISRSTNRLVYFPFDWLNATSAFIRENKKERPTADSTHEYLEIWWKNNILYISCLFGTPEYHGKFLNEKVAIYHPSWSLEKLASIVTTLGERPVQNGHEGYFLASHWLQAFTLYVWDTAVTMLSMPVDIDLTDYMRFIENFYTPTTDLSLSLSSHSKIKLQVCHFA